MTRLERALKRIAPDISGKDVLEVACGCAQFSIAAAETARTVRCIDLDDRFLDPKVHDCANVVFEAMDARAMTYPDASFDTVVLYNAIGHLDAVAAPVLAECRRVLRPGGHVHIISSSMLDRNIIADTLLPLLEKSGIVYTKEHDFVFTYILF